MDIKQRILNIITETQNDITAYLECYSVPLEHYSKDIEYKMELMKKEIEETLRFL